MQQPLLSSSSSSSSLCKADNVSFHKGINYNMTKRYQSNDSFVTPLRKYTTTTATTTTAVTSLQDPTTTASSVAGTIVTPIPSISIATNNPKPFKETFTTITIPKKSTPDTAPTMRSNTSSNQLSNNNNNNKSIINHNNNNNDPNHNNYNCNKSDTAIVTKYPKYQTDILMKWMIHNKSNTCPNQYAIQCLVHETGLTPSQVINWTTNVRKRNVKATCEGRKKPHHFIDFLFLAQEREIKNNNINNTNNTNTKTKTNTIYNKVKKNHNNNNNNNVVPTRLLKRKMIQSTKLQNNNHKCLKSLMVVEPTGSDFSSDKYVMNTNPTNGTTTTSTGGGVIYNNSPTRQYYDNNDDIDTYTPLSLNEPINEKLLEEFVKSYNTTSTKVNWDILPDYKVDSCWKQRKDTNDQTYYCYNNSNSNSNNNSIEYNPILSVVSSSSSTSNSISDTNYGTTTGTYKRRRLNTNNIISPQYEPPTTATMMKTMSTTTTTTNHPMVIDTPSDDIPVTLPPYQCTYSFDIIEDDVNNDMTTTDLRTWALELGIDSELL